MLSVCVYVHTIVSEIYRRLLIHHQKNKSNFPNSTCSKDRHLICMQLYNVKHTQPSSKRPYRFYMDLTFTCFHDQKWLFNPVWQGAICFDHPLFMLLLLIVPDLHCHLYILGFRLDEMHRSCCKRLQQKVLSNCKKVNLTHCSDKRTL